jgi:hypothetical protein
MFRKFVLLPSSLTWIIESCVFSSLEMVNYTADFESAPSGLLYDHRPYKLNNDDYERVCLIPKKKVPYLELILYTVILSLLLPVNFNCAFLPFLGGKLQGPKGCAC